MILSSVLIASMEEKKYDVLLKFFRKPEWKTIRLYSVHTLFFFSHMEKVNKVKFSVFHIHIYL